jgi:hypothetical protein
MDETSSLTEHTDLVPDPLFTEAGASWYWLLAGPLAAVAMLTIQLTSGTGVQIVVPLAFLVLVSGFVGLQVKAARIHTSVELTQTYLRQGTQTIGVREIVGIYPSAPTSQKLTRYGLSKEGLVDKSANAGDLEKWQGARALGELSGVPRGRTGIGVKLSGGRTAQAWARHHVALREALTRLIEEHDGPAQPGAQR